MATSVVKPADSAVAPAAPAASSRPNFADVKLKDTLSYFQQWVRGPQNGAETRLRIRQTLALSSTFRSVFFGSVLVGLIASGLRNHWHAHSPHLTPPAYALLEVRELHKEVLFSHRGHPHHHEHVSHQHEHKTEQAAPPKNEQKTAASAPAAAVAGSKH